MNIFRVNNDPYQASKDLCSKHIVKMTLESCQLLSTALHSVGCTDSRLYKATHLNHPSNIWTRTNRSNYLWLCYHLDGLLKEYTKRFGKHHKCEPMYEMFLNYAHLIVAGQETPLLLAMPKQFHTNNPVFSYRVYYAAAKHHLVESDKRASPPSWWLDFRKYVTDNNLEVENEKNDGVVYE
jgi:hypothetical protein